MKILKKYEDVREYLDDVCAHADMNRESFGFLPEQSYLERAQENRLWVATCDNGIYAGHLIYGGKHPSLKIFQIYVSDQYRGTGLATTLIDEIKRFSKENGYSLVSARVASDLLANAFWRRSGFKIIRQEKGGKTTGRYINVYVLEVESNSLFAGTVEDVSDGDVRYLESPILKKPIFVLDLNLIFDLIRETGAEKEARALVSSAFAGNITLCVTPELRVELERTSFNKLNDPILSFVKNLPVLTEVDPVELDKLTIDLREMFFPYRSKKGKGAQNDLSDLKHIAFCIVHKVDGFVTREKALIRNSSSLKFKYGVEVVSPFDFLLESEAAKEKCYDDAFSLGDEEVSVVSYDRSMSENVCRLLDTLKVAEEEKEKNVDLSIKTDTHHKLVVKLGTDGSVVGFCSWNSARKLSPIVECFLYVDESKPYALSTVDHLIEAVFRSSERKFTGRIDLYTSASQYETRSTAKKRGFIEQSDNRKLSKIFYNGIIDDKSWMEFAKGFKKMSGIALRDHFPSFSELKNTGMPFGGGIVSLFDFETGISPGLVLSKDRGGVVLPIKPKFAKQLLGIDTQSDLFANKEALLHVEKLYVRSNSRVSYFSRGDVVVFYVSKEKGLWGEAIGFARITYSEALNVSDVRIKLSRQGVLSLGDLDDMSDSEGFVHAITFDGFSVFENPVNFSSLKKSGLVSRANLVTAEKLSGEQLSDLMYMGVG